jgi:uncharacterized protein YbjT (DUF2867 family)
MTATRTVLVTGATGLQGGTVARTLLERGHQVRALTRHPDAPAARALGQHGATIIQGDFDDHRSLLAAAGGTHAVFLMSTPFQGGAEVEARQGATVAEAATAAGVPHLVYSSVAGADQNTAIPHFDSKRRVERRLERLGVAWTVLAPASFMEGFAASWTLAGLRAGRLVYPLPPRRPLQLVAVADLAGLAALAIEQPERFAGRRLDLAGDELTGPQMAAVLGEVTGRPITYQAPPPDSLGGSDDMVRMLRWLDRVGYHADIARLRADYPEVGWHSFADWARAQSWAALDPQAAAR